MGDQQMAFPRGQLQWSVSVAVDGLDVGAFSDQEMYNEDVALSENHFHNEINAVNLQMSFVCSFYTFQLTYTFTYLLSHTFSCFSHFLILPHTFSYFFTLSHTFSYLLTYSYFLILPHTFSYILGGVC